MASAADDQLQVARLSHREGRIADAIEAYAAFLAAHPDRGDVWQMRALAEHQAGQLDASWRSIDRASSALGEQPHLQLLAGMVCQDRGDLAEAERRFARAAELKPRWAPPLANRGQALMDLGRVEEALESFRAAADIEPGNARTWVNLGLALVSLERIDEAIRALNHALTLDPGVALAHFNLARIYSMKGDVARALPHAETAARLDPSLTDVHLLLGDLHRKRRDVEGMRRSFTQAVGSAPTSARARNAYAEFLAGAGRTLEARDEYRRVADQAPGDLKAALGANLMLPQIYQNRDELLAWRDQYTVGMARLEADPTRFRYRSAKEAFQHVRWTNFYLAYQGEDDRELQSRYGDFLRRVLEPVVPEWLAPRERSPGRDRIRVGFCSFFFFNSTAGRYFASWITRLDKRRFEPYVYYVNEWVADDTRVIAAAAERFRHLPGRNASLVARQIIDDALDVLVYPELGMHGDTFSLSALRLAPVQVAGWGHPTTTGMPEIDWFLSSAEMEPEGAQAHYRERLALLPGLGTRYGLPVSDAPVDRAMFGLPDATRLYLVPQSLFKIHPDNDALLAEVVARDGKGKLVFFADDHDDITATFAGRLQRALEPHGLSTGDSALFLPYMTHAEYLQVNRVCDVMLDTQHWSGGNTSLDALAMGLPVVTLPGRYMRGRQSAGMLRLMGLDELVVSDRDHYVELAVRIGTDKALRAALSQRLAETCPMLFDRDEPIGAFEAFLERAVEAGKR